MSVRTTVTLDDDLLKLLKLKAIETSQSTSDLINALIRDAFCEDADDLEAFEKRKNEETISFETLLKRLRNDGKL